MYCGAELGAVAYCPNCGCDVTVQRQAVVLSGLYYNQGLEKAQVRDLSGAIDMLNRSLKFNKGNIDARNLLGLVYFETGEVVAALSEWVISKNLQPEENMASDYIANLQKDANRLDLINQTIKKYNIALQNCRSDNEDVAMIQLKKILQQNPKLIKGYHLLALLYIRQEEFEKARRLLKKAIRIDKTNTTTLRFLREVDEQTGTTTTLEPHFRLFGRRGKTEEAVPRTEEAELPTPAETLAARPVSYRPVGIRGTLASIVIGIVIGAAAIWFLFIPARTQRLNEEANEKIAKYSADIAVYSTQNQSLTAQLANQQDTVDNANTNIDNANAKASTYEDLLNAVQAMNNNQRTAAATYLIDVNQNLLSADSQQIYDSVYRELQEELLEVLIADGAEAFVGKDFATAIQRFEAAREIDGANYTILLYLAHSYRLNGDQASCDEVIAVISETFPHSMRSVNAEKYLSTSDTYEPAPDEDTEIKETVALIEEYSGITPEAGDTSNEDAAAADNTAAEDAEADDAEADNADEDGADEENTDAG